MMDNAMWGPDWPKVRSYWSLDASRAHLNHGSFGAVPIPVQGAQEELRRQVEENPMKTLSRLLPEQINSARTVAASFLNADMEGFAFVHNATTGVNTVLSSINLHKDDEVLVTDQTYGSVKLAAERICNLKGARLVVSKVPLPQQSEDELVDAVLGGATRNTKLAIVDHIASPTALVFPVQKIVRELQAKGTQVLVDGAHAPGMVDVNLKSLNPDFWTGNFHKWCCAPRGSAGLWVREDHRKIVVPIIASEFLKKGYPSSFSWLGTDDYTPYLAVPSALDFFKGLGWDRVRNHNRALVRHGSEVVTSALGTEPAVPPSLGQVFEAMTLVRLPEKVVETEKQARALDARISDELAVEALPLAWNGHGYLRLSAQVYNAPAEYERFAKGLSPLLGLAEVAGELKRKSHSLESF